LTLLLLILIAIIIYYSTIFSVNSNKKCPNCQHSVESEFNVCPICKETLKRRCNKCSEFVDVTWKYCPYCKTSLRESNFEKLEQLRYLLYCAIDINNKEKILKISQEMDKEIIKEINNE